MIMPVDKCREPYVISAISLAAKTEKSWSVRQVLDPDKILPVREAQETGQQKKTESV